jgi:hypothetical protein
MASNPPAEAPMPTIGDRLGSEDRIVDGAGTFCCGVAVAERRWVAFWLGALGTEVAFPGVFRTAVTESSPLHD